ncbi:hypothetical protein F4679DRAFT_584102 [Xylaria curta]|nr:hypothetical protein F4679DRAFT_584102 [Xylaria curta]
MPRSTTPPTTPPTQSNQTVSDTQAAPTAQASPATQASHTTYGNPFIWEVPKDIKGEIEDIFYSELFAGTRFKRVDMEGLILYRIAPISFDTNLKPHSVHPAFWTFDSYRAPKISIRHAPGAHMIWKHCYNVLYKEVLRKHDMKNCIVAFQAGDHNEEIYGPRYFSMDEMDVKNKDNLESLTYELLNARVPMLRGQAPFSRDEEEKSWIEYALAYIAWLKRSREARLGQSSGRTER